jgi:hypothetical protein
MAALIQVFPLLNQENGTYPQIGEGQSRKNTSRSRAHDNDFVIHSAPSSEPFLS